MHLSMFSRLEGGEGEGGGKGGGFNVTSLPRGWDFWSFAEFRGVGTFDFNR